MKKGNKILTLILSFAMLFNASAVVFAENDVDKIMEQMSTKQKIAQMIMPSLRYFEDSEGKSQNMTELTGVMKELIRKYPFGGVILFAMNITGTEQTLRLTDEIQRANGAHNMGQMFIGIDQEGGRVARLASGTQFAGNMALGAAGNTDYAYETGEIIGDELQALGINTDFAPVVDVNNNPSNPVIGVRSFSDNAETVSKFGMAFMNGLKSKGIISTLKHFPGHGNTDTDSHTGLPRIDATYDELKACELIPFKTCIEGGAEMIMTAHIQYPKIEKKTYKSISDNTEVYLPATLSQTIITDILRGDMGYDGIVVTDAMEMGAIQKHFGKADAMKLAIGAGADILLCPGNIVNETDVQEFENLISELSAMAEKDSAFMNNINSSVRRILTLKQKKGLLDSYNGKDLERRIEKAKKTVGSEAHHDKEWEITRKAITLVKNENDTLPLNRKNEKTVIITAYLNEITSMEYVRERLISENKLTDEKAFEINCLRKTENGKTVLKTPEELSGIISDADNIIVITELGSAGGLNPANPSGAESLLTDKLISQIHKKGGRFVLLSCNLPYDSARYPDADAVLLAWSPKGMSENPNYRGDGDLEQYGPAMPAAAYMAFGGDAPTGKLPVNIPALNEDYSFADYNLYERGYGLGYSGGVRFCYGAYYDESKKLLGIKRIEKSKSSEEAKEIIKTAKPQTAVFAKMFIWKTDTDKSIEIVNVSLN